MIYRIISTHYISVYGIDYYIRVPSQHYHHFPDDFRQLASVPMWKKTWSRCGMLKRFGGLHLGTLEKRIHSAACHGGLKSSMVRWEPWLNWIVVCQISRLDWNQKRFGWGHTMKMMPFLEVNNCIYTFQVLAAKHSTNKGCHWKFPAVLAAFYGGFPPGVIGDSMGRQLFQRFVSFFRAPRGPVTDAYFAGDFAAYEVNEKDEKWEGFKNCHEMTIGCILVRMATWKIHRQRNDARCSTFFRHERTGQDSVHRGFPDHCKIFTGMVLILRWLIMNPWWPPRHY